MAVFCCCGRRAPNKDKKSTPARDGPVIPSLPPPAILPTISQPSQLPVTEPSPVAHPSQSKCSLPLATPIPGAPLELAEICELVIDDSDSGPDSPQPRRSRASSTLHFVKTHLRKHISQDSLQRQSRTTVGSSTEELARRAELRRLMRKRIQEELQTEDSRDMDSDVPSTVLRLSAPLPHCDQLPGGGPRDNLEFSVIEAIEDVGSDSNPVATEESNPSSPNRANKSETAAVKEASHNPRRVSCPEYMTSTDNPHSLRPASRAALRERRNSLPPPSSSSHSTQVLGSSATGSSFGSLLASENTHSVSRQAVTAVVVNGGISPKDIKRQTTIDFKETIIGRAPRRTSRSPQRPGVYSKSRSKSPPVSDALDLDHSPMKTWLRCQELCNFSGTSHHDELPVARHDGPSDGGEPGQVKPPSAADNLTLQPGVDVSPVNTGPSELQDATVLRGGALGDADCSHIASSDCSVHPPSAPSSVLEAHRYGSGTMPCCDGGNKQTDNLQPNNTCRSSTSMSNLIGLNLGFGLATKWLQPFSNRDSSRNQGSRVCMVQGNISTVSLPVLESVGTVSLAPSGAVSESSSYYRRETELLSIPKRFTPGRVVKLQSSSRFREEFEEQHDKQSTERPSLLTLLHLAMPKRAKLASRVPTSDDGVGLAGAQLSASGGVPVGSKHFPRPVVAVGMSSLHIESSFHFSNRPESTEDAWRRAIRAEADERRSLICGSSKRSSLRTPSPCALRTGEGSRLSTLPVNESSIHRTSHSDISKTRTSISQQQYEYEGFLKSSKRSNQALEDWARQKCEATVNTNPTGGNIPRSWARFPSHTRQQRNGPASKESHVLAKDFAVKSESVDGIATWLTDQDSAKTAATAASAKKFTRGSQVLSRKLNKLMKVSLDKLVPSRDARGHAASEAGNSGHLGPNSDQVLSNLEYPELQIQPSPGAFRELQALEHEIESLKGTMTQHSRQQSAEARQIDDELSGIGRNFVSMLKDVSCSIDGMGEQSTTMIAQAPLPVKQSPTPSRPAIAPTTPCNNRILLYQELLLRSKGSSASESEVFVTPSSQISNCESPTSAAVSSAGNRKAAHLDDGSASAKSAYTVITGCARDGGADTRPSLQAPTHQKTS
ncbi:hypothetical protein PpBr36_07222 [Pyricularia pennisetigena]|uniref:hypothetical protein n=1 Tax=Pyricularia pennisetigena TaxID=1578925 RepID=UPI001152953A|nr:hypothetical protein PpBr36_07222 [Pyricularia pennisetigena]TLS25412.1 hypothetical protein PpBr36_07222 [Pyricularia pennisetigena]